MYRESARSKSTGCEDHAPLTLGLRHSLDLCIWIEYIWALTEDCVHGAVSTVPYQYSQGDPT